PALAHDEVRRFIQGQRAFTETHDPAIMAEIRGIAAGFGLDAATVFDYLHCSSALDLAALAQHEPDGCTSFAMGGAEGGAILAKNRDYRAEHIPIQRVMRHADPAWGGREIMVVGSLGSPGNFSSGINSDGLAVADTASRTTDMGIGLHRYFLLTGLLVACRSVDEALSLIRRTTHTGSGLLVLGDAGGAVAAVELGHRALGFEHKSSGRVGRTNHFATPAMAPRNLQDRAGAAGRANSARRLRALDRLLAALPDPADADAAGGLLARHGKADDAFCRHGGDDLSSTIAGAVYLTGARRLLVAFGNPCSAGWRRYDLSFAPEAIGVPAR
ncbi:MAG TPA: C45 family peptidase, partial [Geminicoccaceae bacterium]|nr:C45 family peptidase [Geminicoccaceae bacterium]